MNLDFLINNAKIYDGTGSEPVNSSLGIKDSQIVFPLDKEESYSGRRVIDVEGKAVAPGFINIHGHSDETFLIDGRAPSAIFQGITTEVTGNCGYSLAPLDGELLQETRKELKRDYDITVDWKDYNGYFERVQKEGISINMAALAGHGNIRGNVVGMKDRKPSAEEIETMKIMLQQAIEQGVFGMSTGLVYIPGMFSKTPEIVKLARVLAKNDCYYTSHMRSEGENLLQSIEETISIGLLSGCRVEISHLKAAGERNWGKTKPALELIEKARQNGLWVQQDQYPYTASATGLTMMVPDWVFDGGTEAALKRMKDPEIRMKIIEDMKAIDYPNGRVTIVSSVHKPENKSYEGQKISTLAQIEGKDEFNFVLDLLVDEECAVGAVYLSMCEEDVIHVMKNPFTSVCTDATARSVTGVLAQGKPHPRSYGAFPRMLARYVREKKILTWQEAIRRMTSLPAAMTGIENRGQVSNGFFADLVVFDESKIQDRATFEEPHKYSEGIEMMFVNGNITMENGEINNSRNGRILRKGLCC